MNYLETLKNMVLGSLASAPSVIIYIAIVALFILGLVRCVAPVLMNRWLLSRAVSTIRVDDAKEPAWQEDGFLGRGALLSHWSEYLNNLFFADGRYHNASKLEDYINEETVIYGPGRVSFAEALPGLLTSLGFLGTLIGLAQGLSGFNMSDSAAVQASIVTLIPGMRYAFMTSIFGVVGSVMFTLITRAVYGSTEHVLTRFYAAMSRYAGVDSVDPMTQIAIYQQEQTALIKTMTKDINGKFTETMSESILKAMEPVNTTMQGFVSGISREQARLIDAVLARFLGKLDESLDGSLKRYARVLDETTRVQRENVEAVRNSMAAISDVYNDLTSIRRVVQELLTSTTAYVQQLNNARQQSDEAYKRVLASVEQVDAISRQQSEYLRKLSGMQNELNRANKELNDALEKTSDRFANDTNRAAVAIQKAANELRVAGQNLAAIHTEAARSISSELNTTLDSYRDYVNQFTQRVDYLSNGIVASLEGMPAAVNEANNRLLDQVDALTEALEQANRALDAAVDHLYRG